jgi:hypothetical protein
VSGEHHHDDNGGTELIVVGAGIAIGLVVIMPIILAILQTILFILLTVVGIGAAGTIGYLTWRVKHPRAITHWEYPGSKQIPPSIPKEGYHVLTTAQLKEILGRKER